MGDRVVVSCGDRGKKLFISSREGATLHEIALHFAPDCLDVSASTVAVGGDGSSVCLVGVEAGNIIATLPVPALPYSLDFNEQGTRLACGLASGLNIYSLSFLTPCVDV